MAEEKQTTVERRRDNLARAEADARKDAARRGMSEEQTEKYVQSETYRERKLLDNALRVEKNLAKVEQRKKDREAKANESMKKTPADQVADAPGNAAGKQDVQDNNARNARDQQQQEIPEVEPAPLDPVPNKIARALKEPPPPIDFPKLPFPASVIAPVFYNDFMPLLRNVGPPVMKPGDSNISAPRFRHPFQIVSSVVTPDTGVTSYQFSVSSYGSTITDGTNGPSMPIEGLDVPSVVAGDGLVVVEADVDEYLEIAGWTVVFGVDSAAFLEVEMDPIDGIQTKLRLLVGKIAFDNDRPVIYQYTFTAQRVVHGFLNGALVKVLSQSPSHFS